MVQATLMGDHDEGDGGIEGGDENYDDENSDGDD